MNRALNRGFIVLAAVGVTGIAAAVVAGVAGDGDATEAVSRSASFAPPPSLDDDPGGQRDPIDSDPFADENAEPEFFELRKLTDEEINRLRFLELRAFRPRAETPDRVTVEIPRDVVDDFLVEMEGHPNFRGDRSRRAFYKLTPPQKLFFIAKYKDTMFMDRITIETDPETFLDFRRRVMPTVLRGCATTGCHSPTWPDAAKFGLFKDPKKLPETTYANFIILNDLSVNGAPVLNRARPDESLLLTYLLPHKEVKIDMRHPGDVELDPVYQSRRARGYRRIERWIGTLREPQPNYGARLVPAGRGRSADNAEETDAGPTEDDPTLP